MVLSDDVSGDDSIDDGTECDEDNMERREDDWGSAAGDDHYSNKVDATDSCFHWTGQDAVEWGKVESSTHIRRRWQNILRLLAKQGKPICPLKNGTVSLQMRFFITLFNTQISIFL